MFNKYLLDIVGWWVLLNFPISLMIFYLGILQIERGVFMSPTIIVDLSIHPFSLISFASHVLQLLFGACIYLILLCLLDGLSLLSLHNELLCLWLFSLPNLFYLMLIQSLPLIWWMCAHVSFSIPLFFYIADYRVIFRASCR